MIPIRRSIARLRVSGYARNVAALAGGTAVGQAAVVVASPILRRLYDPYEFGAFSLVVAIAALLLPLSTGRYELAIMLPKEERNALHLVWLSALLGLVFSAGLTVIVFFAANPIASLLGEPGAAKWLWVVPVVVLLNAAYHSAMNFSTRNKNYGTISRTQVAKGVSQPTAAILAAFSPLGRHGPFGLLLGHVVGSALGIARLARPVLAASRGARPTLSDLRTVAARYSRFPVLSLPAGLANVGAIQLFDVFIAVAFSLHVLGQYSLSKMLLALPATLLGRAVSQVYYQRLVEAKNLGQDVRAVFVRTLGFLVALSGIFFCGIYVASVTLIEPVFGSRWHDAATYAQIMVPLTFVTFVASSIGLTPTAFERQDVSLRINVSLLTSVIVVVAVATAASLGIVATLSIYAVVVAANYLCFTAIYYRMVVRYQTSTSLGNR